MFLCFVLMLWNELKNEMKTAAPTHKYSSEQLFPEVTLYFKKAEYWTLKHIFWTVLKCFNYVAFIIKRER